MLAAMWASVAANDGEGESTREVGGVNLQLFAKVLQASKSKKGEAEIQLKTAFEWVSHSLQHSHRLVFIYLFTFVKYKEYMFIWKTFKKYVSQFLFLFFFFIYRRDYHILWIVELFPTNTGGWLHQSEVDLSCLLKECAINHWWNFLCCRNIFEKCRQIK